VLVHAGHPEHHGALRRRHPVGNERPDVVPDRLGRDLLLLPEN
jgi:hypothetical protein